MVTERDELPRWLWLWVPPMMLLVIVAARLLAPDVHERWLNRKEGPIEWATVLVLLPAVAAGIDAFRHRRHLPEAWLGGWTLAVTAGALYFAGEEVSWGQTFLHWETPEAWRGLNRQSETNVHNVTSWLNQKPRLLLELFVLVGGLIVPLVAMRRWRTGSPDLDWRRWFWPTTIAVPTAALAIGIYLPDHAEKIIDDFSVHRATGLRLSEAQEYYFAYFLLVYLLSLAVRLRRVAARRVPEDAPRRAGTA